MTSFPTLSPAERLDLLQPRSGRVAMVPIYTGAFRKLGRAAA